MSPDFWMSLMRRVCFLSGAAILAVGSASAQPLPPSAASGTVSAAESSSSSFQLVAEDGLDGSAARPSASSSGGSAAGQHTGSWKHNLASNYALEFGGGFNGPTSGTSNYVTWGGNFTAGGGLNFSKRFALLAEYQFIGDKLPGNLIAETGANGGHAHIWSLTLDPVLDLFPKSANDLYVTGGGGFYRKVTSFTDPEEAEYCSYYYCEVGTVNQVVGHFSSNQGGFNIGGGYQHRVGGISGDGRMKLFAEIRYLDVNTPAVTSSPNGLGTTTVAAGTKLIPVTLGLRW